MPGYYDDWKNTHFVCQKCGWNGSGQQLESGEMFRELYEVNCPRCHEMVTTVMYPTIKESRDNLDKVSPADKLIIEAHEIRSDVFKARKLSDVDQLPEIDDEDIVLIWDLIEKNRESETVIRYGAMVIWREPAFYEGYERFIQVADILAAKYGRRLQDLVPTRNSRMFLYGDRLSSIKEVEKCRQKLGKYF